jgi:hypothetical protein
MTRAMENTIVPFMILPVAGSVFMYSRFSGMLTVYSATGYPVSGKSVFDPFMNPELVFRKKDQYTSSCEPISIKTT